MFDVRILLIAALSTGLVQTSEASIFPGRPDAIVCSVSDPFEVLSWDRLVFYVSGRVAGGATLYKSLTSSPVLLTVEADGRVRAENLADCDGRSVAELRKSGRAFDYLNQTKP